MRLLLDDSTEPVIYTIQDGAIYALDAQTGELHWSGDRVGWDALVGCASASIVVRQSFQYLAGLAAADGTVLWSVEGNAGYQMDVTSDDVVLARGGSYQQQGYMEAFDAQNGTLLWRHVWPSTPFDEARDQDEDRPVWHGDTCYYVEHGDTLVAIVTRTGEVRWRYHHPAAFTVDPAVDDDFVIIGTADEFVLAFAAINGELTWRFPMGFAHPPTTRPRIGSGRVLVGAERVVVALDAQTGQSLWHVIPGKDLDTDEPVFNTLNEFLEITPDLSYIAYLAFSGDPHSGGDPDLYCEVSAYDAVGQRIWRHVSSQILFMGRSHDRCYLWFAEYDRGEVWALSPTGQIIQTVRLPSSASVLVSESALFVASSGNLIAYSSDLTAPLWHTPIR